MNILPRILFMRRKSRTRENLQKDITAFAEKYNLNDEETELVTSLLEGKSNKVIALDQKLTPATVEYRLNAIYRKLNINSRAELFAKFRK